MSKSIAYLAQGRIRLKNGADTPRTIESLYGSNLREKAVRSQQRNAWKSEGSGFLSGAALWGKSGAGPEAIPLQITSLCTGTNPGEILYSLESGSLCALLSSDSRTGEERRLWNNNNSKIHQLNVCPTTGNLACSVLQKNGTANIGVMLKDEPGIKEVTEGDSVDTAPRWVPGEGRKLVFQSAGVGRNREGHFLALGPFCIQQLDVETARLETLLEDSAYDYLAPRVLEDGTLYCIRRPHSLHQPVSFWRTMKDIFLLPFRLLYAVFQFLQFFSMRYTGKKLTTAGNAQARPMAIKQMMIYGNLVQAQDLAEGEDGPDLVPASWQLIRRAENGQENVLAKGVLAYDLCPDGSIIYSNGSAIYSVQPDGKKEKLLSERLIEQVAVLPAL